MTISLAELGTHIHTRMVPSRRCRRWASPLRIAAIYAVTLLGRSALILAVAMFLYTMYLISTDTMAFAFSPLPLTSSVLAITCFATEQIRKVLIDI